MTETLERTEPASEAAVDSVVKPVVFSHGTMGCIDMEESRKFYEEFLGLDVVRHRPEAMKLRKAGYWSLVCLEIGDQVEATRTYNHWGLDVATRDEVDAARDAAERLKDKYGIRKITKITVRHDDYGFKLQDRDGNWWEIQCTEEPMKYDRDFKRGDSAAGPTPRKLKKNKS